VKRKVARNALLCSQGRWLSIAGRGGELRAGLCKDFLIERGQDRRHHARKKRLRIHPGEILSEEFLKPLGLSMNQLALALRVPGNRINAIVAGQRGITADTALRLGRYFGTSPQFWINIQGRYDLESTKDKLAERIEREVRPRDRAA
jgi:addiction module HigA family antidote